MLVNKGLIELDLPAFDWVERFVDRPGLEAVPLDHRTAALAYDCTISNIATLPIGCLLRVLSSLVALW